MLGQYCGMHLCYALKESLGCKVPIKSVWLFHLDSQLFMQYNPEAYHPLHGAAVRGDCHENVKVRAGCKITNSDSKE